MSDGQGKDEETRRRGRAATVDNCLLLCVLGGEPAAEGSSVEDKSQKFSKSPSWALEARPKAGHQTSIEICLSAHQEDAKVGQEKFRRFYM